MGDRVIRLGLRLTVAAGREGTARLVVTAAAMALGVGLLLVTLAGINATNTQNARLAWLNTGFVAGADGAAGPLWWKVTADNYDGTVIGRVDVAATGPGAPVPPGIPALPGPGQFYASPALGALLRSRPAAELGDRYPGTQVGTIGAAALPAPNSLVVIVGHAPADLADQPGAARVTRIATVLPSECSRCLVGINADGIALILSVIGGGLIFPLLILIGTATRLAAARREQRFAAMRLVGATPRQVALIAAVESTVAAVAGVAGGFGLFFLLRGPAADFPFTGDPFFPADLSLRPVDILVVALGVPVAAAVAARFALRRVRISPLGVSRRVTPGEPVVYRVLPLALGVAELLYFLDRKPHTTDGQIQAYLGGFLLIMVGLVVAGPWFTMVGARVLARRTSRPAALIAGRRLADNPQAGFRSISGLVLALFVMSAAVAVITTMNVERDRAANPAVADTVYADYSNGRAPGGAPVSSVPPVPDAVLARLRATPGVRAVSVIHTNPLGTRDPDSDEHDVVGLVSCRQLAAAPVSAPCAAGGEVAAISAFNDNLFREPRRVWPVDLPADRLDALPVLAVFVATDGSTPALEEAKTTLMLAYPGRKNPVTAREAAAEQNKQLDSYRRLVDVVILASFLIAGCSLAVSVAAGLSDRKRPFSLLRLTGVPLGVLRRVVALESAVPLLVVAVVATGMGFLSAHLFVRSQMGYTLHLPPAGFYVTVLLGLVAALAVIGASLPLLNRITGPEVARNE